MKTRLIIIILALFSIASLIFFKNNVALAEASPDSICYVSFGDSIAVGYKLPSYINGTSDANDSTPGKFVENSYAFIFKTMLENKFGTDNVVSITYSTTGDDSSDLLSKLNNTTIQSTLKNADIVTICIGANDILGPALNNIGGYILKDEASGSVSVVQMENLLTAGLEKFRGTNTSEGNFDKILNKLNAINPNAKYIFTNIYNPYKVFKLPNSLSSLIGFTNYSASKINQIGAITEIYLAGGINSQNQTIQGLNQILQSKIEEFNKDNFMLVDSYSTFDSYSLLTTPKYNELVYASLTESSNISLGELINGGADVIMDKADPHPTEIGHNLLYDTFKKLFEDQICALTFDFNGETINGKSNEIYFYNKNAKPTLLDINVAGKVFGGWHTSDGNKWTADGKITKDTTLYANWGYGITYELNGGINHPDNLSSYTEKDCFVFQKPSKAGYTFDGWYLESTFITKKTAIQVGETGDIKLYAKWTPITYTITYELNGGVNNSANKSEYTIESNITFVVPSKTGYTFEGWYLEESLTTKKTTIQAGETGNITLYAKWKPIAYTITYVLNGGTNHPDNPTTLTAETQTITLNSPTREGCTFAGWYKDIDYKNHVITIPAGQNEDITLYAKWDLIIYFITYELNGGVNNSANNSEYTIESNITFVAPSKTGYTFEGWYLEESLTTKKTAIQVGETGNITLYAKWKPIAYTITYVLNGGTNHPDNPTTLTAETQTITLNSPTREGCTFAGWYKDIDYKNQVITIPAGQNEDITLYAKWDLIIYFITYELNGGVNNSANKSEYTIESNITFVAPSKTGYTFEGWYLEESLTTKKTAIQAGETGNITLYAKWKPIAYTITYVLNGGTNHPDNPNAYTIEENIIFKNPTKNAEFKGWYTDISFETQITEIYSGTFGNITLYAKWEKIWRVTFNSNGGTYCGPIDVKNGFKIPNSPQPKRLNSDENIFIGWYYNNELWDFNNNVVINDMVLIAKWAGLVCDTMGNLEQTVDNPKQVDFSIQIQNAQFAWYVDGELQKDKNTNTFSYTPNALGTYTIYCVVNDIETKKYTIVVDYAVPNELILNVLKKDTGDYSLSIEDGHMYCPNKIVWYKTLDVYSNEVETIGTGPTCDVKLDADCYIYAVYDSTISTERIKIVVTNQSNGALLLIIGGVVGILCLTVFLMIISRKKYNKYY